MKTKVSPTRRLLESARSCFAVDNNPAVIAVAANAEAMEQHGVAAAQQMRVLVASSLTGVSNTSTILPTMLFLRWAQVADFLREFTEFVDKTCTSSACNKSSRH